MSDTEPTVMGAYQRGFEAGKASAEQPDLAEALRLLKLAACPANCYGGAIDCGGYQHPCQWCDEVEAMVAKIEESE
jgi:hypothetical protein